MPGTVGSTGGPERKEETKVWILWGLHSSEGDVIK